MSKAILCKLLGLFVLSVAVAACSSDSGSNGGSSGSGGGGGGGGGELVDQCVNEPDKGYVESGALAKAARDCGQEDCIALIVKLLTGNPTQEDEDAAVTCVYDCVLEKSSVDGVSTGCVQCFANSSACGALAACADCMTPESCKCVDCLQDSGCQAELDICTGVIREFECTP